MDLENFAELQRLCAETMTQILELKDMMASAGMLNVKNPNDQVSESRRNAPETTKKVLVKKKIAIIMKKKKVSKRMKCGSISSKIKSRVSKQEKAKDSRDNKPPAKPSQCSFDVNEFCKNKIQLVKMSTIQSSSKNHIFFQLNGLSVINTFHEKFKNLGVPPMA